MGILSWLSGGETQARERVEPRFLAASIENPSTNLANPAEWLVDALGGAAKYGPAVSESTAMACSAVYRCVALRSGIIASLPLKVYKRTKDGREPTPNHRLQPMFQVAPYPGRPITAFTWREIWGINHDLWGNHYSIIRYDRAGRVIGFEPVLPWDVEVYRIDYRNKYRCLLFNNSLLPEGGDGRRIEWVDQEDMIHIPGPGFDGLKGLSRIRAFARNAVSLASLLEDQTGIIHENAARPSAYVTVNPNIGKEAFARFRSQFEMQNTGRHNAGRIIYGDKDTTLTQMQMTIEDLQTIEARKYQVADISRFYGVPLHLLNETEKSTSWGTGLSEQTLAFLIYAINPDLERIEAELNYKLFAGSEYYVEFDRDALLAMDPVKAAEIAQTEIASGVLLVNERRRMKNRPPVDNGNEPLINSANVPLSKLFAPDAQPRQDPIQQDPIPPKQDVGASDPADGEK